MKRRWWLIRIGGGLVLIVACCLAVWQFLNSAWPCSGDAVLQEMDTILRSAQRDFSGAPSEEVSKWALLTVDSPEWIKLRTWMANAPGKYQLVLLALDQAFSPGDDAMVGAHLSSGIDIECTFYNSTLTDCSETDRIVPPEERAANGMKDLLQAARDHPIGSPPENVLWAGFLFEGGPAHVWTDLQRWMSAAPGDFKVETPEHVEHQCKFVEYTVRSRLSNGLRIACQFNERLIRACEEVK